MGKNAGIFRHGLMLVLLAGLVILKSQSPAQDEYQIGRDSWMRGEYRSAYEHLIEFRKTEYGRTAEVDFMLATSACRLPEREMKNWGCDVLDWILHRYDLSAKNEQKVTHELGLCRTASSPELTEGPLDDRTHVGASASVWGSKMYYWLKEGEVFNNYRAEYLRDVPKDSLLSRVFALTDSAVARQRIRSQFPDARVFFSEKLVFVAWTGHDAAMIRRMASYLEKYLLFLERQYNFALPGKYITIYLVPSSDRLRTLSATLHGIRMSRTVFGYSFRDDLSVVAAVPPGLSIGTVMHELFHLGVRSRFGDIPMWLDEGMASLYEVAEFRDTAVLGMQNWRGEILKRVATGESKLWPDLDRLITSNWFRLERAGGSAEYPDGMMPSARELAAMLATARYFALYAQQGGRLRDLYYALQNWEPGKDTSSGTYERQMIGRVETVFGKPIGTIDDDFRAWFRALPQLN